MLTGHCACPGVGRGAAGKRDADAVSDLGLAPAIPQRRHAIYTGNERRAMARLHRSHHHRLELAGGSASVNVRPSMARRFTPCITASTVTTSIRVRERK